jgi:hypothetical protein
MILPSLKQTLTSISVQIIIFICAYPPPTILHTAKQTLLLFIYTSNLNPREIFLDQLLGIILFSNFCPDPTSYCTLWNKSSSVAMN